MLLRLTITIALVLAYFFAPQTGYTPVPISVPVNVNILVPHLIYPLSHANIFHLLCNLFALWAIKGNLHLIPAILISFVASYLPTIPPLLCYSLPTGEGWGGATMGFSGILCAIIGIKWGIYFANKQTPENLRSNAQRFLIYVILPLTLCALIPNINWSLHLYCLLLGLIIAPSLTPNP